MTSHDYNRTHDPMLRGWTRKQPRRTSRRLITIIGGVLLLVAALVALIGIQSRSAHGQGEPTPAPTPGGDPGVVCAAQTANAQLTICPPSYEAVTPRAYLPFAVNGATR